MLLLVVWGAVLSYPDSKVHLIFCDVGQGDAILVTYGKNQILIDAGPNRQGLNCLSENMPFWDKTLELVILTHPEADHMAGLISVFEQYQVGKLIANSLASETGVFSNLRAKVIEKQIAVYSPENGDKIQVGKLEFKILFPFEKLGDEIVWKDKRNFKILGISTQEKFNETAIVTELDFGDFKALLTGDIGMQTEREINDELGRVNVLKVAHHGSKGSTSEQFLNQVSPSLAVISAGFANRYGHPSGEVLDRLKSKSIRVLRTDLDGTVEVVTDGKKWGVKSLK